MKKSEYTGILKRPIIQDENEDTARKSAYAALFEFHGIAEPFTPASWENLAKALAAAHVPAFFPQRQRKKRFRRIGNRPKLHLMDLLRAWREVSYLMRRRQMRVVSACRVVWQKGYSERCAFVTFRKTICALDGIPRDKLFGDRARRQ